MLTYRQAVRECKRLWRHVLVGKAWDKDDALKLHPEFDKYQFRCPFCQYVWEHGGSPYTEDCCSMRRENLCPLVQQTGWACQESVDWLDYRRHPETFASVIMALKE